ncbi:MAG: TetR/AcrR family transcriptional regulator [Solirubrobacterales bacterium]|nr:TetR/AcrR family transcriptional regulator [Solirubrobacterales bacterium]
MDRLPRGRHGLSPEFVARNQRERLIAGLTEVLYEVGYQKTTVSLIGQRASVSKSDFYKHFGSKDECFFAAYEAAIERIREQVQLACRREAKGSWPARVRNGIASLLSTLAADPAIASISLVEGLRVGRGVYDCYQAAVDGFVASLRDGAPDAPGGGGMPAATDEAVIGGIASLLGRRVLAGEAERIEQLLPEVLEFALTPYLGTIEARRIISAG